MSAQQYTTKLLLVIVIVLVVVIYIQYYSKYNTSYEITQTYLDKISIDLLYERNPIVIYDTIKNPKQLLGTLFKYSYVTKNEYKINHQNPLMNRSKFSYVYSTIDTDTFINIINPSYRKDFKWTKDTKTGDMVSSTTIEDTNVQYITIKLKPLQVLIVPSLWIIQTNQEINKINLHDFFSMLYFKFAN